MGCWGYRMTRWIIVVEIDHLPSREETPKLSVDLPGSYRFEQQLTLRRAG